MLPPGCFWDGELMSDAVMRFAAEGMHGFTVEAFGVIEDLQGVDVET